MQVVMKRDGETEGGEGGQSNDQIIDVSKKNLIG